MKKYEISMLDIHDNYFHFTWECFLDSIKEKGLLPKKGRHAEFIEETEKVFFVKGLDNLLILFDCWINVYKKTPLLPKSKLTYGLASKAMRSKYFPMFLVDLYFLLYKNSKKHLKHAYKRFDEILSSCILLKLDLKEGIDFSLDDIDQIKAHGFRKRHLIELGYSEKYSDMHSTKMDECNLHTKSNLGVLPDNIQICSVDGETNMLAIFEYALSNTDLNLEKMCPTLYEYLKNKEVNIKKEVL